MECCSVYYKLLIGTNQLYIYIYILYFKEEHIIMIIYINNNNVLFFAILSK